MHIKYLLLLSICSLVAQGAIAQQLYKVIDANGKVTYSDRPKADDKAKLSVMQSYTLRPVAEPKPIVDKAEQARAKRKAGSSAPAPVVSPGVEELMVTIMGLSAFGGRFEMYCSETVADGQAFSAATLAWKQRNLMAIEQQRKLLMLVVSPAKRAELLDREEKLLAEEIGKISARTQAGRKEWCEGVVAELNSGRSDINSPEMMDIPITPYKSR